MRCACGIGVAVALSLVPAWAAEEETSARRGALSRFNETTVRSAVELALAKLALPGCSEIYGDFKLPNGSTPRGELVRLGIGPEEFLRRLLFVDGSRDRLCRTGRAVLTATPGSRVIRVCPGFAGFQLRDPNLSASLIIHESLHALGLGEDPPSGRDITQRIERRCWKPAARIP
jgi:hypothetical protein